MTGSARAILVLGATALFAGAAAAATCQTGTPAAQAPAPAARAIPPGAATVTYRKVFKSSTPEFVEIEVDRKGDGSYDIRQLDDRPRPQPFLVTPKLAAKIFALASELHDFQGIHLEAERHIANLGVKTFVYSNGPVTNEVTFNFTLNSDANELLGIFEGISLQDQYIDDLRSAMRYDPLGLNDVLLRLAKDLTANSLPDPKSLVPVLRQIAAEPSVLDIARSRARQMANAILKD